MCACVCVCVCNFPKNIIYIETVAALHQCIAKWQVGHIRVYC